MRGEPNRMLKKRMVKAMIWSVVLCRSEMQTIRNEDITRLDAFEMYGAGWKRLVGLRVGIKQMQRYCIGWKADLLWL